MKKINRRLLGTAMVGVAMTLSSTALAEKLSIHGAGSASLTGIVPQTLAQYTIKAGHELQVVLGQTLTKSMLQVVAGKTDITVAPPNAYGAMKRGVGPYAKNAEQAKKLSANMRALFGFPGGTFHTLTWADSGINSWDDFAGKRVYIGPPAGIANRMLAGLIKISTTKGLEKDKDYKPMRAPWGAGQQAFQDGQFDVHMAAVAVGSQSINELSLQRKIRIFGIPDSVRQSEAWKAFLKKMALIEVPIPAGTYAGQVNKNETVVAVATAMMMAVNKKMSDKTAYDITKAYWSNLEAMKKANALMRSINEKQPFEGMNAKLHPGAVKYYKEAGVTIPAHLMP